MLQIKAKTYQILSIKNTVLRSNNYRSTQGLKWRSSWVFLLILYYVAIIINLPKALTGVAYEYFLEIQLGGSSINVVVSH